MTKAIGRNSNQFFVTPEILTPIIKDKSKIIAVKLPTYFEYDVATEAGVSYTFYANTSTAINDVTVRGDVLKNVKCYAVDGKEIDHPSFDSLVIRQTKYHNGVVKNEKIIY